MKHLLLLLALIFNQSALGKAFEIPRSEIVNLTEKSTSRVYSLFVKVPLSYKTKQDKTYPVVYLTDAPYAFQVASGVTRLPMNSGVMEEAIVVGIAYEKGSKGSASRVRDYTPSKASSWKLQTGGAEAHVKFIRHEVIPYIESQYRVDASQRTFVGNSLGGLFGAYILFNHPDLFSNYILGSPSVWFNNHEILSFQASAPVQNTKVYLAVGSLEQPKYGEGEDMVGGTKALGEKIDKLQSDKIELKVTVIEGAKHVTAFPTTLVQGLDWILGSDS